MVERGQAIGAIRNTANDALFSVDTRRAGQLRPLLDGGADDLPPVPDREDVLVLPAGAEHKVAPVGNVVAPKPQIPGK